MASNSLATSSFFWLPLNVFVVIATAAALWVSPTRAAEAPPCDFSSQQSVVINFFIHDDLDVTPTASAFTRVSAVNPVNGASNTNNFGSIAVLDDAITEGPNLTSKLLARGRGFYVFDYLPVGGTGLEFVFTAIFTNESDYSGSTLTFKGYDRIDEVYRELAITGGTGLFRLARGWAGITTFSANGPAAILNTTCYVYYGCSKGNLLNPDSISTSVGLRMIPSLIIIVNIFICSSFLRSC